MTTGDYPADSVRRGEQGSVIARYLVQQDGSVGDVQIVVSSGIPRLDNAARDMIQRRWKFRPATQAGVPVPGWLTAYVKFQLNRVARMPGYCRQYPDLTAASIPPGTRQLRRQVLVNENGKIVDALLLTRKGWMRLNYTVRDLGQPVDYLPHPNNDGKPVRCWIDADVELNTKGP